MCLAICYRMFIRTCAVSTITVLNTLVALVQYYCHKQNFYTYH